MSSHHFVKEGQEPALFILGLADFTIVEPMLEWAPLVIVDENALDDVLTWGIKIDIVVCVTEHQSMIRQKVEEQAPVRIITRAVDSLETIVHFLISMKQAAVNIIAGTGEDVFGRLEQVSSDLSVSVILGSVRYSLLKSVFSKWYARGTVLHLKASGHLQLYNLRPIAEGYEVERDGMIQVSADGQFWVGEEL